MVANIKDIVSARIPIHGSQFQLYAFPRLAQEGEPPLALVLGDITNNNHVLTRVHSECLTGDIFGSKRCDCGFQLEHTIHSLIKHESGLLIYLRQEGRGIGLVEKLKAYALQDKGLDTVEANLELGHAVDGRSYDQAARIIEFFKLKSIQLMTNNPHKVKELNRLGIVVSKRLAVPVFMSDENQHYLKTKKYKLDHILAEF